jgi:predicted ATPase
VISSLKIEAFRGVREGLVEGLSPISILVGPNNSGKSTCLEAALMPCLGNCVDDAARILMRRGGPPHDALQHVVTEGSKSAVFEVRGYFSIDQDNNSPAPADLINTRLDIRDYVFHPNNRRELETEHGIDASFVVNVGLDSSAFQGGDNPHRQRVTRVVDDVMVDKAGRQGRHGGLPPNPLIPAILVDVEAIRTQGALEDAYSRIERARMVTDVVRALQRSMPRLTDLRILKSGSDFLLHTFCGDSQPIPAYLAGDGLKRFLELAAAIFDTQNGVVLLEEPEAYQHPRYMTELVALLLNAAKSGTQIILSTHSIELIDLLLHAPEAEGLAYPTVHRLRLVDGKLASVAIDRDKAISARDDLLQDLRA